MPIVKLGIIAVSRDCFPMSLSISRRQAVVAEYTKTYGEIYECQTTVENEVDMRKALAEVNEAGCNALVVFLGNFGPESSEILLVKEFCGPSMVVAAAEEAGDRLCDDRGDAYCGMLNASYNLKLRNLKAYIPEYPVGTASEVADMINDFKTIARTSIALNDLKLISFGPRPQDFLACNAPIKQLYNLGIEIQENSELDLFEAFNKHAGDARIPEVVADMAKELGDGNKKPEVLEKLAQYELTLLDWIEANKGSRSHVVIAGKCWPAFQTQFGFVPCYVNSRLAARGIPVSCEVDIYGALSEYIGQLVSEDAVTLLDINNSVPRDMYESEIMRDEEPEDHGTYPSGRGDQRNSGGRSDPRSCNGLPSAEHLRRRTSCVCGRRRDPSGTDPFLRRHRYLRHPGNGTLLPSCPDREELSPPCSHHLPSQRTSAV